jgi:hypothetical protein
VAGEMIRQLFFENGAETVHLYPSRKYFM